MKAVSSAPGALLFYWRAGEGVSGTAMEAAAVYGGVAPSTSISFGAVTVISCQYRLRSSTHILQASQERASSFLELVSLYMP